MAALMQAQLADMEPAAGQLARETSHGPRQEAVPPTQ
jgi:hypothetical protein